MSLSNEQPSDGLQGRIYKTLKIGMVGVKGSLTDKFKAARAAGFQGVEMNSPGMKVEETRRAIAASGLPVDGTVCSTHWQIRHTSSKADQRAQALEHLEKEVTHYPGRPADSPVRLASGS